MYFIKKIIPLKNRKWLIIFSAITILFLNINNLSTISQKRILKTPTGLLVNEDTESIRKLFLFLDNNLKKDENFIVVPEGQILNLIYQKPYPYYYSTFTPLDFETFGEKRMIKDVIKNKPDYIIFYPRNTKEYGSTTICYDYGVNFCTHIMENYFRVGIIEGQYRTLIFKKK